MDAKDILLNSLVKDGYLKTPSMINAFRAIDRADFVLPEYKDDAYDNYPLPIGEGQTISQPLTVAFMLELLEPEEGEKILDIGAGSGWQTALLAEIVGPKGQVVAIERIPELCRFAEKNLDKYELIKNGRVRFYCQDATVEIPDSPYDKIIVAAAASKNIPDLWRKKLKVGGKIVAPIAGSIWLFIKNSATEWEEKEFPGFAFVPLVKDERRRTKDKGQRTKEASFNFQKKFWIISLVFSLLAFVFIVNEIYFPHFSYLKNKTVEIESGLGSRKIADLLKKDGIIRSKWSFIIYISLKGVASELKPGQYNFGKESISEIAEKLVRGGTNEITVIFPEGWNIKDIAEYLEKEKIVSAAGFKELTDAENSTKFSGRFDFLKDRAAEVSLEGYLFPDTYRIYKGAGVNDILIKMLDNFGKKLTPDLRAEIARQGKTIFEIVTIASLIEKEVDSDEDRSLVSGILWKRLNAGIPLQVDATIVYLTGRKTTKVSRQDVQINSPYNTYKYRGLPKGPIANPGLSAIRAAVFPKKSPYLYYLSADDGKTIFSKTLEEHNETKTKYLTK